MSTTDRTASTAANPVPAGIGLRDWFAGQALNGMIPAPKQAGVPYLNIEGMAKAAYAYADAMLAAREV